MLLRRRSSASEEYPSSNPNSLALSLLIITTLAFWLTIIVLAIDYATFLKVFHPPSSQLTHALLLLGLVCFVFAALVEITGRIARGAYLAKPKGELATSLGHALVRHPQYFFYSVAFFTLGLMLLNPLLLLLIPGAYGYYETAKIEDQSLSEHFGDAFRAYAQRTGMIFPFLGRWK